VRDALGRTALPLACRQFPRVVVRDPRGMSIVLLHYGPTAAAQLGRDAPVEVTESSRAFPLPVKVNMKASIGTIRKPWPFAGQRRRLKEE
jgi:hypothetical protein